MSFFALTLTAIWYSAFSWFLDKHLEFFPTMNLTWMGRIVLFVTAIPFAFLFCVGGLTRRLLDFSTKG